MSAPAKTVVIPGDGTYAIAHAMSPQRAIIEYQPGIFLCVDAVDRATNTWVLSPTPADEEENIVIAELSRAAGTLDSTVVTKSPA